jgi:hypothetical protein
VANAETPVNWEQRTRDLWNARVQLGGLGDPRLTDLVSIGGGEGFVSTS